MAAGAVSERILLATDTFLHRGDALRIRALASSDTAKSLLRLRESLYRWSFRPQFARSWPKSEEGRDEVLRLASAATIRDRCDVLSENGEVDGRTMPFWSLFAEIDGGGSGTFAVLEPAHLAFWQGESAREMVVLYRPPDAASGAR